MSKKRSIISLVLVLFLMLQVCGAFPVSAADFDENADEYVYSIPTELISEENMDEYGHVARVFAAEGDMNEICILNEDGSNSVYIFDYPVKYVDDSDGKIKDKSNKLYNSKRNNYLYVNEDNDVRTVFPKKIIKHPVITTIGDYEISIGIITDSKYPKKGELVGESYVLYKEAFGENTAIGYKVEFDGYKEEVIIYSENAPKIYSFEIKCEGLILNNVNGTLTFVDEVSGDIVFTSDPLYIYDSSVQENGYIDTTYEVKKVDDYEYVMTIELNETFLQTEGLTYPIYIDPSIKYNDRDYIHDAPIYTARADEACGNHLVSYVGKYEDAYGVGRLLVRFPEMRESGSVFRSLDADEVISVKMYLYNSARGSYTATIKAYQFLGTIGWDESTVTWNNAGANSLGDLQASVGISSTTSGYYAFDITDAAKLWVGNLRTADYRSQEGIIFLNANESDINYARSFRMSNFGASYTPYIIVNYSKTIDDGTYYIQNVGTGRYIDVEGPSTAEGAIIQQWDLHAGNQARWVIARQTDGYYTIKSLYSNKYIGVEDSSIYNNAAIKQYASNASVGTRWGFSVSATGNYIITSKATGTYDRVLSVPLDSNSNGTDLVQYTYSDDSNYRDEWDFQRILPTNGYELAYSPSSWSGYVQNCCNCYAYALNNQVYPNTNLLWFKQQMGYYKGANYQYSALTETNIYTAVVNDYSAYNEDFDTSLTFQRIGRYDVCPAGTYKVALVVSEGDYHWYRQDADGLWSHKRGLNPVERTDYSGKLIIDPYIADRGDYTEFLGYYAVTPWSESFTANGTVYCYVNGYMMTYAELMNLLASMQSVQTSTSSFALNIEDIAYIATSTSATIHEKGKEVMN